MEEHDKQLSRVELTALATHSSLEPDQKGRLFQQHLLIHKTDYLQFIRWVFLVGGISLLAFGFVFFFAFNWRDMSATYKFAAIWLFLVVFLFPVFLPKSSWLTKQLLVTMASVLVGVLFAVFGQVYQTGAFTYQYIGLWLILILGWVVTMHFAPLWLVFHTLAVLGLSDYFDSSFVIYIYLLGVVGLTVLWNSWTKKKPFPYWYILTLLTPGMYFATISTATLISNEIFLHRFNWIEFLVYVGCIACVFILAFWKKWVIPIAHISLSVLIVLDVKIVQTFKGNLLVPAFITLGVLIGSVFIMMYLRKIWKDGTAK